MCSCDSQDFRYAFRIGMHFCKQYQDICKQGYSKQVLPSTFHDSKYGVNHLILMLYSVYYFQRRALNNTWAESKANGATHTEFLKTVKRTLSHIVEDYKAADKNTFAQNESLGTFVKKDLHRLIKPIVLDKYTYIKSSVEIMCTHIQREYEDL